MHNSIRLAIFCAGLAVLVLLAYVVVPVLVGERPVVLPLDDVYIHFQYAKQIANGEPYVYNPGSPPSSGATSLLYPYLLAVGYLVGLQEFALGWWALLLGTVALAGSGWLVAQIARAGGLPTPGVYVLVVVYVLTGSVGWHFMSGMETGLLIGFMLLTLYAVVAGRCWWAVGGAVLMAVTRPEGAIMAVVFSGVMGLHLAVSWWRGEGRPAGARFIGVILPVLALGIQPLVNWLFTGSAQAAGSSAKSILSMVPAEPDVIAGRIIENFGRMWWEFLTGYSAREGLYLPVGLAVLALLGLWAIGRKRWAVTLLVVGWLSAGTLAVATLDPAFWHFKRYQMPFMALLFPLAGWGAVWLARVIGRWAIVSVWGVLVVSAAVSGGLFWRSYQINVDYLLAQQIPMAQWLKENTPDDAVIAVHDVGLMRYIGERTTVDMVGLTTAGAADSWRNGPGAVAEFMAGYVPRPDYVASYTDALGLSYLADTGLYGRLLVEYPVNVSDRHNVALAGTYQGVWEIDWTAAEAASAPRQSYPLQAVAGRTLVDDIDVADLQSEAEHAYEWANEERLPGFPTEVYEFDYAACDDNCTVLDGGRRINGYEQFKLNAQPERDLLLVTRIHPAHAGTFDVYVGGERVATRTIPAMAGWWLDVVTVVDAALVDEQMTVRIEPETPGGHYMPYMHWAYQGDFEVAASGEAVAAFGEGLMLTAVDTRTEDGQLIVDYMAAFVGEGRADYRLFVHVYDDLDTPPIAQADRYPLDGATPPGNWLPGEVSDRVVVDLTGLVAGSYPVAIGFYDPVSGERLTPQSDVYMTDSGRLLLDAVEVE